MTHPVIDTDVIVRLLTGDDPTKQAASLAMFERIEAGEITAAAPVTVFADATYVLTSQRIGYMVPRQELAAKLSVLASIPGFRVENRNRLLRALELFGSTRIDFGDCFIIASMEHSGSRIVYSWDRHYDRFQDIERREP